MQRRKRVPAVSPRGRPFPQSPWRNGSISRPYSGTPDGTDRFARPAIEAEPQGFAAMRSVSRQLGHRRQGESVGMRPCAGRCSLRRRSPGTSGNDVTYRVRSGRNGATGRGQCRRPGSRFRSCRGEGNRHQKPSRDFSTPAGSKRCWIARISDTPAVGGPQCRSAAARSIMIQAFAKPSAAHRPSRRVDARCR